MKIKNASPQTSPDKRAAQSPKTEVGDFRSLYQKANQGNWLAPSLEADAKNIMAGYDLRRISPIQMAELCNELYQSGVIEFDDFVAISFQPELNPEQYLMTHGKYPQPIYPKDVIQDYYQQLEIARQQNGAEEGSIEKLQKFIHLLESLQALRPHQQDNHI